MKDCFKRICLVFISFKEERVSLAWSMFGSPSEARAAEKEFALVAWPSALWNLDDLAELFPSPKRRRSQEGPQGLVLKTLKARRGKREVRLELKVKPKGEIGDLLKAFRVARKQDARLEGYELVVGHKISPSSHYLVMMAVLGNFTVGPLYPVTLSASHPSFRGNFEKNLQKILRGHKQVSEGHPSMLELLE